MAGLSSDKLRQIEAEMNRFEMEVLSGRKPSSINSPLKFLPHAMQQNLRFSHRPEMLVPRLPPIPPMMPAPIPGMPGFPMMHGPGLMVPGQAMPIAHIMNPPKPPLPSNVIAAAPTVYATTTSHPSPEPVEPGESYAGKLASIKAKDYKKMLMGGADAASLSGTSLAAGAPAGAADLSAVPGTSSTAGTSNPAAAPGGAGGPIKPKKPKKALRTAAGNTWEDNSLLEWDPNDFRLFCGDLGNEVSDELLAKAFRKYSSFNKAKVIRDKRTNKTKGYGFVSFSDSQDFIKAMREMDGKYVGNRPVKLRKSTWRDRNLDIVRKKTKEKQKLGLKI